MFRINEVKLARTYAPCLTVLVYYVIKQMHLLFKEFSAHIETCVDSLRFSLIYPHLVGSMKVNNWGSKVSLVLVEATCQFSLH